MEAKEPIDEREPTKTVHEVRRRIRDSEVEMS